MRRILVVLAAVLASASVATAAGPNEPKTIFDHAQSAWAVGTIGLGTPLAFREGRVLVFPTQIEDLLWAKQGKPRNLMLVYEVASSEVENPFFKPKDLFFAPIELLPEHSYWRDNLPVGPHHAVAGGRRNVFRGDEIPEARAVLGRFLEATQIKTKTRWGAELDAVAQALSSSVPRLSEDAVGYLAASPRLASDFPDSAREPVTRFLEGPGADSGKLELIDALGRAKVTAMTEELRKLGEGSGPKAAAAMVALDQMGNGASTARLLELSRSSSDDVRAYAGSRLGQDRSGDKDSFDRAVALLDPAQPAAVRAVVAEGMGWAGNVRAIEPLRGVLGKADAVAKTAAAAIARIGGEEAGKALKDTLLSGPAAAAAAAVDALAHIAGCGDCRRVLLEQHTNNPDKGIRDLIGVVLELPHPHEH